MAIRVTSVFCDDIRQESNGKLIFVGVYPVDLVPGAIPATFVLALWLRIEGLPKGEHSFTFTLKGPKDELIMEQSDKMLVPDESKPAVLIFIGFPISVDRAGEVKGTLTIDGEIYDAARLVITEPQSL